MFLDFPNGKKCLTEHVTNQLDIDNLFDCTKQFVEIHWHTAELSPFPEQQKDKSSTKDY